MKKNNDHINSLTVLAISHSTIGTRRQLTSGWRVDGKKVWNLLEVQIKATLAELTAEKD